MLKRTLFVIAVVVPFAWVLFTIAGRWDWIQGWGYLGVFVGGGMVSDLILWRRNPDLLRRRGRIGEGTKTWDKIILGTCGATSVLIMIVGALDSGRYHWSMMALWLWPVGAALCVLGQGIITWSMTANPFFEKTARIQTDQSHRVIDGGPYRHVRHPGYTGTIAGMVVGAPLMLGSWWAFIPAVATVLGLVLRTVLEDRMLMRELDGYEAYARRVRFRLVPYVW